MVERTATGTRRQDERRSLEEKLLFNPGRLQQGFVVIDQTREENYEIQELLGSGGEGFSYLATSGDKNLVLKFVQFNQNHVDEHAENLRRLHLKVNSVLERDYSVFEFGNCLVIRGDYVEGNNLVEDIKQRDENYSQIEVLDFLIKLLENDINTLHESGSIHGDIKPANVIVNDGEYKSIDFGALRDLDAAGNLTLTGTLNPKTLAYSRLNLRHDRTDDFYSSILTAYFLLSGEDPLFVNDESKQQELNIEAFDKLEIDDELRKEFFKIMGYEKKGYSSGEEIVPRLQTLRTRIAKDLGIGVVKSLNVPEELSERSKDLKKIFSSEYSNFLAQRKPASKEFVNELDRTLIELGYSNIKHPKEDEESNRVYVRLRKEAELSDYVEICNKESVYLKYRQFKGDTAKARKLMKIEKEGSELYKTITLGTNITIPAIYLATKLAPLGIDLPDSEGQENIAMALTGILGGLIGIIAGIGLSYLNNSALKLNEKQPYWKGLFGFTSTHLLGKGLHNYVHKRRFNTEYQNLDALEKALKPAPGFTYDIVKEEFIDNE